MHPNSTQLKNHLFSALNRHSSTTNNENTELQKELNIPPGRISSFQNHPQNDVMSTYESTYSNSKSHD